VLFIKKISSNLSAVRRYIIFSPLNTFMRKGMEPEPVSNFDPYLLLMDPDPGGPKTSWFLDLEQDPFP
jgi:hypothetical protein